MADNKSKSKKDSKTNSKGKTGGAKAKKLTEKELPVEVVCIIDRSGSMRPLHAEVIGGLNRFVSEQKKIKGAANLTLVEFDDEYNVLRRREDLQKFEDVTEKDFVPRGWTALNDAIGRTVVEFSELRKAKLINKVIFCIMTDGEENASKEFTTKAQVKVLTDRVQKDYNWEFIYLGANQDSFKEGAGYGILRAANFAPDARGVACATETYSAAVKSFRTK